MIYQFFSTFCIVTLAAVLYVVLSSALPVSVYFIWSALLAMLAYAAFIEPNQLKLVQKDVRLSGWPSELDGIKIGIIGCLHAGAPFINEHKIDNILKVVAEQNPQLIVSLGDHVGSFVIGGKSIKFEFIAQKLSYLKATAQVVVVLGNHDWWHGRDKVRSIFEQQDLTVLENETVAIGTTGYRIAGLKYGGDYEQQIRDTLSSEDGSMPIVVLSHSPDVFPLVPQNVPLSIASHTHGGQIRLPLFGSLLVPSKYGKRYASGLVVENNHALFVTSGVGTSMLPLRMNVPPEVVILTVSSRK